MAHNQEVNSIVLRLQIPISFKRMLDEQRRMIARYPMYYRPTPRAEHLCLGHPSAGTLRQNPYRITASVGCST
ncbi:MAG: hypothetical protein ACFCUG_09315 [Thiotrichales bacterium]